MSNGDTHPSRPVWNLRTPFRIFQWDSLTSRSLNSQNRVVGADVLCLLLLSPCFVPLDGDLGSVVPFFAVTYHRRTCWLVAVAS